MINLKKCVPFVVVVGLHGRAFSAEATQPAKDDSKAETTVNTLTASTNIPSNTRFVYPDFLPDPKLHEYRHPVKEKLERQDMINRR